MEATQKKWLLTYILPAEVPVVSHGVVLLRGEVQVFHLESLRVLGIRRWGGDVRVEGVPHVIFGSVDRAHD